MWIDRDGTTLFNIPNAIEEAEIEGEPRRFFWSVEAFGALDKTGLWNEVHLELIEGVIYERARASWREQVVTSRVSSLLASALGDEFFHTQRTHTVFGTRSQMAPDIAVYRGRVWENGKWPTNQRLIIEVSDEALEFDQTVRASVYARFGVLELWIVNLRDEWLEVRRNPHGAGYGSVEILDRTMRVGTSELPHVSLEVADLLP